ncbi:DUF305 domain-containing protein [Nocardioides deserti]|uniref:DUF305 domain-containing protein n=1 Tax=Nocardioides deserti TaxID=1588644 RepID=UPI001E509FEC|nr:DUF305 domain-containing protein [Nocardioides deserti]
MLTATLAACGDEADDAKSNGGGISTQESSTDAEFNSADVDFATQMIPHHAQAVEMAEMTEGRDLSPAVEELAANIKDAQVPEVEVMTGWLEAWGEQIPDTSMDHADTGHDTPGEQSPHGMDGMDDMDGMAGMMSSEDMTALKQAPDAEFEDMWLAMMIEHHKGALKMAEAEQRLGRYPDAVALAEAIVANQQSEIAHMVSLLD